MEKLGYGHHDWVYVMDNSSLLGRHGGIIYFIGPYYLSPKYQEVLDWARSLGFVISYNSPARKEDRIG